MTFYKAKDIVKQGSISIMVSVTISSFAGTILNSKLEALLAFPLLLVLVPCIADTTGNIGSMIGSKIATWLHLGIVRPKLERNAHLEKYVVAIVLVAALSSLYLVFISMLASYLLNLGAIEPMKILIIVSATSIAVSLVATVVGILVAFASYRYGWDPDNVSIPIITAIGDVVGSIMLLSTASILGLI